MFILCYNYYMDLSLVFSQHFELANARNVAAFVEYFEDAETRGITLTERSAAFILEAAAGSSKEYGRILLDPSLPERVAMKFSQSDFLSDFNFAGTVAAVLDQILRVQSETGDAFSDAELVNEFFDFFESRNCAGSISLIEDYATQIIERFNLGSGDPLSREELSFTTFDFKGFKDAADTKEEDEQ